MAPWISPSAVMDMIYDVRADGCEDLGYALLRPRSKGKSRTAAELVNAKLSPVKPTAKAGGGMAVTARDHRLILAPRVADPRSIEHLLADYDAQTKPRQPLLAAVLTMKLDPDMPLHDGFDRVCAYATFRLARVRRLTSIAVLHTPSDELVGRTRGHAHLCILARRHLASGWAEIDPDLTDEAHRLWADEWRSFSESWDRILPPP
ncbi:MAG: hypothetical protein EON59_05830 [Alphaproteobacteria bacterium]|nr:MAG: hypothetical protein EON59_05830 [Alphaproteobacteria bacterium]